MPHGGAIRREALFLQLRQQGGFIVPERQRAVDGVDLLLAQSQGLADVTQRPAPAVALHGAGQRRPLATVLGIDVLDHLLAAPVLEVDVDVRRFAPLPGNEALEQQVHACRIDLGHAQQITDRRVGRRAATLAQDAAAAGEGHQFLDGEEVVLVAEFGDQRQFLVHLRAYRRRAAIRVAAPHAGLGQRPQPVGGAHAGRHQFLRILVAQFVQAKRAALGNRQRLLEQRRRIEPFEHRPLAQVPLGIREQRRRRVVDMRVGADAGQHVLQRLAPAHMHVHVAAGHQRPAQPPAERRQRGVPRAVLRVQQALEGQPQPVAETRGQRLGLAGQDRLVDAPRRPARQPQGQQAVGAGVEVRQRQAVAALGTAPAGVGDQGAELRVGGLVRRQQHQLRTVLELQFAADDQRQAERLGRLPGTHDAGQRARVGQCQRPVAEPGGARHQLLRVRGAALEGEIRQAVQLGVAAAHCHNPCR